MDARYKVYAEKVKTVQTLGEATRAIAAYLAVLDDSHTIFIPPRYSFQFSYDYRMQMIGDKCFLTNARPGSEAAEKLHPGDQVLSLDGYVLNRKDLWQLEYYLNALAPKPTSNFLLRDHPGTERHEVVHTTFGRVQSVRHMIPSEYRMEREKLQRQLKNRHVEQGGVMIWKLPSFIFGEGEIDHLVGIARKRQALVLDLRGNEGGSVTMLAYLVGSLFDHDVKLATRVSRKDKEPVMAKSRGKSAFTGKLIVLVDSRSASAAEVLARVVQLEHRGEVVGDRSSGSVMEANVYPFHWGLDIVIYFAAEITTANLIMADGHSLEKVGVIPDVIVLPTAADLAAGRDPVLSRAAEMAGTALEAEAAAKLFPFVWTEM